MAYAVVVEDRTNGFETLLLDRGGQIVDHQSHAPPSGPAGDLGPLAQGEGADFTAIAGKGVAGDRPVGRTEFDIVDVHAEYSSIRVPVRAQPADRGASTKSQSTSRNGQGIPYPAAIAASSTSRSEEQTSELQSLMRTSYTLL